MPHLACDAADRQGEQAGPCPHHGLGVDVACHGRTEDNGELGTEARRQAAAGLELHLKLPVRHRHKLAERLR